jgi:putative FmdB family regulatory protein
MPLYEYRCDSCGKTFEVMQRFSDEPLQSHADCGGAVHRLISAPALQFKGSGWYITDYAKGNAKNAADKTEKKDSGESKTESKSKTDSSSSSTGTSTPASSTPSSSSDKK